MKYYQIISSNKTNDKTDIYLMIKDKRLDYYNPGKQIDLDKPINLFATNIVSPFRELDFPGVGCPEIVSKEFKELIENFKCCDNIQFLPTYVENFKLKKDYYVLNFLRTERNYFDEKNSKTAIFGDGTKQIIIPRIKSNIESKYSIFKIKESPWQLFVNENFVNEYKKRKLIGCDFFLR